MNIKHSRAPVWIQCNYRKACLVQGANKRVQVFARTGWENVDNNLLSVHPFSEAVTMRYRYDANDYPTEQNIQECEHGMPLRYSPHCEDCMYPSETLKSRPDLFPPRALQLAGEVLAFGETKYPDAEWKRMSSEEHIAASMRHLLEHLSGNLKDSESLKLHLTHSFVRLGMALEKYVDKTQ